MARIVGIHGIGQQYKGAHELHRGWWDALRDGLVAAKRKDVDSSLAEGDLEVSFFGTLFRPPGAMGGDDFPPYTAKDLDPEDRQLLEAFYTETLALQPELAPPSGAMGSIKVGIEAMAQRLLHSPTFASVVERAFIGNLKQVSKFLQSPPTKDLVFANVAEHVTEETRIVIGHSLGSVVAYEYLCREAPPGVELLITLGSPLGIPNLIFDHLTPAPTEQGGAWPGAVRRWVNIADPDDVVALRKDLAGLFPPPPGVDPVLDEPVENGDEPHAISRYLNSAEAGTAVAAVLAP